MARTDRRLSYRVGTLFKVQVVNNQDFIILFASLGNRNRPLKLCENSSEASLFGRILKN